MAVEDGLGGDAAVLGGVVYGVESQVFGGQGGEVAVAGGDGSVGYRVDDWADAGFVARGSWWEVRVC